MTLEFLCLKWAVTEKFYDYLYVNKFKVKTDNNPFTYVLTKPSQTLRVRDRFQHCQHLILRFHTNQEKRTWMQMPCQGTHVVKKISSKVIQAVYGNIQVHVSTHIINMAGTTEPLDIVEITDNP